MPHLIDFDKLECDLFVLQHAAYGSKEFCERFGLNSDSCGGDYEWWEYKGLLKSHVSNTIIETAVKVRMLQDFAKHEDFGVDLKAIDSDSRKGLSIGKICGVSSPLSLRESCNKIIHATEASMEWVHSRNGQDIEFWSGVYELSGENKGANWNVELQIPDWCTSMIRFNKIIQESVDWHHVYKYDV